MMRPEEPGKNWTGNERYIGYCVDLAKRISEMVQFDIVFELKYLLFISISNYRLISPMSWDLLKTENSEPEVSFIILI